MLGRIGLLACTALALVSYDGGGGVIRAVGSSTVYPFTKAVGDAFVQAQSGRKAPVIESIGLGRASSTSARARDPGQADIADASRRRRICRI